ncbi:MAG: hypothetical protein LIO55_08130 [Oscillospiraceae bacterium]|nr:hypothetical protein [Oscillospiraceae bacterium]
MSASSATSGDIPRPFRARSRLPRATSSSGSSTPSGTVSAASDAAYWAPAPSSMSCKSITRTRRVASSAAAGASATGSGARGPASSTLPVSVSIPPFENVSSIVLSTSL